MATVEITALDVLVLKKLVLINAALAKALTDPKAAREQMAMTREVNEFVLRADMAVKSQTKPIAATADIFTEEQKAKFRAQDALYDETMKTP